MKLAGDRRTPFRRRIAAAALGALGAAVLAGGWDARALARRASKPPHDFHSQGCAGHATGGAPVSRAGLAGDWTSFEATPAHDLALPGSLRVSWRFTTGGSVVTPPTVVGGTAYVASMDGCVYALDAASGRLLWSFAAANQVMSEPLVVGGTVYFGSGDKQMVRLASGRLVRGSGSSGIYALDARTGALVWMYPTLGEDMPTPAYRNGVVYEASGDQWFYAVDGTTGRLLWRLRVGSYDSMSSPLLSGEIAVFGGAKPYALYGVDVSTGRVAWELPLPHARSGVDDGTPAISGGVAYVQVPRTGLVPSIWELAVRTSDGQVLWARRLGRDPWNLLGRALGRGALDARGGEQVGTATVAGGVVYVGTPALPRLWALRASDGTPVWRRPVPLPVPVRTAPLVAGGRITLSGGGRLLILSRDGRLLSVVSTGVVVPQTGILIPCTSPAPEVVGQTLFVGSGVNNDAIAATRPVQRA